MNQPFTCVGVNRHNCCIWGSENPHQVNEYERDTPKLNVWLGLHKHGVISPFFLHGAYSDGTQLPRRVGELCRLTCTSWFHIPAGRCPVTAFLDETFPGRWVRRGGPTAWPPRSPDLTPLDFFARGFIKDVVYSRKV